MAPPDSTSSHVLDHPDFNPLRLLVISTSRIHACKNIATSKKPRPIRPTTETERAIKAMAQPRMAFHSVADDERVQCVMPDLHGSPPLHELQHVELRNIDTIKSDLFTIASDLYAHLKVSELWVQSCRDGSNDLLWFIHRVKLEKPSSFASVIRAQTSRSHPGRGLHEPKDSQLQSTHRRRIESCHLSDLEDFEDLYYMVWHKILSIYQELQIRYKSRFITMTDTIHLRGISLTQANSPFTVVDFVTLLHTWWDELTDPSVVATLDHHLRLRVFSPPILQVANRLSHGRNLEIQVSTSIPRLDFVKVEHTGGLRDLSALSPVAVIDHVYKKHGFLLDCERETEAQHQAARYMKRTEVKSQVQLNAQRKPGTSLDYTSYPQPDFRCTCVRDCPCRDLCTIEPDEGCLCAMRTGFYTAYEADRQADLQLEQQHGHTVGEHFLFGAPSNEAAQLIVAQAALLGTVDHHVPVTRRTRDVELQLKDMELQFLMQAGKPLPSLPTPSLERSGMSESGLSDSEHEGDGQPETPKKVALKRSIDAGSVRRKAVGAIKRLKTGSSPGRSEGSFSCY